jgi:hypothetical protein
MMFVTFPVIMSVTGETSSSGMSRGLAPPQTQCPSAVTTCRAECGLERSIFESRTSVADNVPHLYPPEQDPQSPASHTHNMLPPSPQCLRDHLNHMRSVRDTAGTPCVCYTKERRAHTAGGPLQELWLALQAGLCRRGCTWCLHSAPTAAATREHGVRPRLQGLAHSTHHTPHIVLLWRVVECGMQHGILAL